MSSFTVKITFKNGYTPDEKCFKLPKNNKIEVWKKIQRWIWDILNLNCEFMEVDFITIYYNNEGFIYSVYDFYHLPTLQRMMKQKFKEIKW